MTYDGASIHSKKGFLSEGIGTNSRRPSFFWLIELNELYKYDL